MTAITIGRLAEQAGMGVETVRFYERRGLIEDPPRCRSGYRRYPLETVDRLAFIRRAKRLGFTLDEIGELLKLWNHSSGNREGVRAKTLLKLDDIDRRLLDLSRMRAALADLADACARGDKSEGCPILAALDGSADLERSDGS